MSVDELTAEILKLPRDVRARLAEVLIDSLDEESSIENAWIEEAEQRYERYATGDRRTEPVQHVLAKIRQKLNL